jgi:hypothetical protein
VVDNDRALAVDVLMAVAGRTSGEAPSEDTRAFFESMADKEERVVLRCGPFETFAQSPAVRAGDESAVRGVSGSIAWDAPDPS